MEEVEHLITVLESTKQALQENNLLALKDLSNQTIHCAATIQDEGSITIAVLVYSLSKLIERKDHMNIKNWDQFSKKIKSFLSLAVLALEEKKFDKYIDYLGNARKSLNTVSSNLKPFIQEVIRKAAINKASQIYKHGISLEKTANLLGITQWELAEYTGQTKVAETNYNITIDVKKRAKIALEFFS